jgi:hypothetical protein
VRGFLVLFAAFGIAGGVAEANGGARYDFRAFPSVGTPTTTFRVSFSAPFAADDTDTYYVLEGVGPRGCPTLYELTSRRIRRGDRVVMRLTAFDDLYFGERRRWCRGAYVGYVYWVAPFDERDRLVGYLRFGVGRSPVSLEG